MTGKELKQFFETHLVPSSLYKIGGKHNHRICMEQVKGGWEVFFSDHKDRIGVLRFADEASACVRMKEEIRKVMEQLYGLTWAAGTA